MLNWKSYPNGYVARYFLINGRSMPDTIAPNNAPWMPGQPFGAMAHVEPWSAHVNPLDAMIRYVAVGVNGYDFHPHSNHEHVIAADGALMKGAGSNNDNTEGKFNIMVCPGVDRRCHLPVDERRELQRHRRQPCAGGVAAGSQPPRGRLLERLAVPR